MKIKIGKANDNDFVLKGPSVSRYHAILFRNQKGTLILEDLHSTNGTFVDDSQILRKPIRITDQIKLGDEKLDIRQVLRENNNYIEEFNGLKQVYDDYIKEKVRIQSSNQFKTRLLQSLPFALPGVVGVLLSFAGKGNHSIFVISLIITILAPTIGIYLGAKQSSKTPGKLQAINNQFKIKYVCPKCGTFLGEIPWESLRNRKRCPVSSCKAIWAKD